MCAGHAGTVASTIGGKAIRDFAWSPTDQARIVLIRAVLSTGHVVGRSASRRWP